MKLRNVLGRINNVGGCLLVKTEHSENDLLNVVPNHTMTVNLCIKITQIKEETIVPFKIYKNDKIQFCFIVLLIIIFKSCFGKQERDNFLMEKYGIRIIWITIFELKVL